ncbi:MAG: metallophosphoesterase [Anaerolineales bacterium]|jgi:putative phosphoesterase
MKIAVISDTHDNLEKIDASISKLKDADVVLHCGDLCAPFVIKRLGEQLEGIPLHVVWGNNEGDTFMISKVALNFEDVFLHGELAELDLGGLRIAVNHYPRIARGLARSGLYDLVCYGHDHSAHTEKVDDCILLNPGEILGMNGSSTLAMFDTETREVEHIEV